MFRITLDLRIGREHPEPPATEVDTLENTTGDATLDLADPHSVPELQAGDERRKALDPEPEERARYFTRGSTP